MTDGIGIWTFGYDNNSQLTSVDGPWANDTITYVPDELGRISQMIPQGGTAHTYLYDTLNRLTEIQRGTENFVYTYSGVNPLVQQLNRPNGSVTEYQYNALSQLTNILNHTSTGDVLSQHTYTYNAQDLRANEIFDGSAIPPAVAVPDINTTYNTNDVNQLLSTLAPDRAFVYDDDGNMTQGYTKDGYVFTAAYDAENRMTSIQYTDSSNVLHRQAFRYSGDGLLAIERHYENGTLVNETRIVRDGMLAIQDRNASNTVVNEYTWGLNLGGGIEGLLNLKTAGQNYAYLYDGKGNIEAVIDSAQAVVAAYRYDPFGVLVNQTGNFEQPFGFSTKRTDPNTGQVFYQRRVYAPEIGRWLTRDPLGETGGLNLYAFVGNNPVNWVDPWGLITEVIITGGTWYGHVGVRINNRVYSNGRYNHNATHSFGLKGDDILNVQDYNSYISYYKQKKRNSTGYVLNVSPEQEKKIEAYYKEIIKDSSKWQYGYNRPDDYKFLTNNCTTTVVNALNQGLSWYNDLWIEAFSPYQLQFHLMIAPWLVDTVNQYPGKK